MSDNDPDVGGERTLVPGELRGYRQFLLCSDGLYPLVHSASGPWDGELERARCALGAHHDAPASDCRCGLYAWYLPGSATVALGPASAVVRARGRCILADRGFRAAEARIEAIALPLSVRLVPTAAGRARRMLAAKYPRTTVYTSVRRMLREHPPDDVRGLGIDPPRDRSRGYRTAAGWMLVGLVVLTYSLMAVPREAVAHTGTRWWPLLLVLAIGWQAGLVWIFMRLLALQGPGPGPGRGRHKRG